VEVLGVRRGADAGAAVVGLGEAGAGRGDSSGAKGVVGDHAAFHKGKAVEEVGPQRVYQPHYSPESYGAGMGGGSAVDTGEDLWEHIGEIAAVEGFLRSLAEDKARVRRLTGYPHIRTALRGGKLMISRLVLYQFDAKSF
jgi:hypothetical protein